MIKNMLAKIILSISLIILSCLHIFKGIFTGFELNQFSILVFIVLAFAIYFGDKRLYSIGFIFQGIMTILTMVGFSNLSPVPIFFIALWYCSNIYVVSSIIIVIPVSFILSSYIGGSGTISNMIEGVLFNYAFLIFLYFAVIKQPENIEKLSKITPLTKRQLLILKYLAMDIPRKQIPDKVKDSTLWRLGLERDKFTLDIINSEIAKIKKILDIVNGEALGVWYNKHVDILNKKG